MKLFIFFALTFIFNFYSYASDLPNTPVPGGIATISIGQFSTAPLVKYKGKRVMTIQDNNNWYALVGIGLSESPGQKHLDVHIATTKNKIDFNIKNHKYESQYITLKTNKHVNLSKANLDRHYKEKARSRTALNNWQEIPLSTITLKSPTKGVISSPFGLRRFYNKQPRKPHSGIDIAAPTGTPIYAPLAGTVTEEGNFFFNGNVIFIDHGHGLITMYCHQDENLVKKGQKVKQGDLIGKVGSTGRVTGPHLHWGVSLNGNMVDPLLLTPELREKAHK
ncbi:MAG: M23 family metallopeptidase [Gammaproteobacteria bacterium]|nr:MAG: M23 family metallopeptidase [Gammaproteobacteria bacterium]